MLASTYISDVRSLVHDQLTQDWTDTELLNWVNQSRQRVAIDCHCVRNLFIGNIIANQEIYQASNAIPGITVTAGGTNYTNPVVVIGAPPAGGVQATATATLVSGVITQILMTNWGSGYVSTPSVSITDGAGTGVVATANAMLNTLDTMSITALYPGLAQGQMLAWYPFTIFQAWLRFNRQQFGFPAAWTRYDEQGLLYFGRPPDQPYVVEIDAIVLSTDLATTATNDIQINLPFSDLVKFYTAYLALAKLQNYEHAQFWEKKYNDRLGQILRTKQDRRIPNIYSNTYRRLMRGW